MSRIRGKDTSIEIALRRALWAEGLRFRKNVAKVLGKPDVVFARAKVAVFCDSSFWHGRYAERSLARITSNREYWRKKILGNVARDKRVTRQLRHDGWIVLRFWDDDIETNVHLCLAKVRDALDRRALQSVGR
jgi:DNA mismatch endonuclease (patch repair protein)